MSNDNLKDGGMKRYRITENVTFKRVGDFLNVYD